MIVSDGALRDGQLRLSRMSSLPLYESSLTGTIEQYAKSFAISLALSKAERSAACDLINRKYGWRGYGSDHALSRSAECATFSAYVEGEVVGTLSLTVDSPSKLAADATFADTLDALRQEPGTTLCELTKFALNSDLNSMHILATLFHTIFIFGTSRHQCSDLIIEVNPRHIRFYEAMLAFEKVGGLRTNEAVDAPSQLMRLKVADIGKNIQKHAGTKTDKRSLYPYFLTAAQECIIHERMADLDRHWPFN